MTPFARFLRGLVERLLGTFHEGPEPPARLREMVLLFAEMNPDATRRDWLDFASQHAAECYRTGWLRGYEATVRGGEAKPWVGDRTERMADELQPGWRSRLPDPQGVVPDLVARREE